MLHGHEHRAAPLAANTEALDESQEYKQNGSPDADL